MYPFQSNFNRSTTNSRVIMAYLSTWCAFQVEDLTDDADAQRRGIDFRVAGETAEFKDCQRIHTTRNLAFEVVSNTRRGTPGACLASQAQLLFYYDTVGHVCHVVNLPKLRSALECSPRTKWDAYKVTTSVGGELAYATIGLLLPLSFIQTAAVAYQCLDLNPFLARMEAAA